MRNKVEAIRDSEPGSHLRTWNHLWRVLNDHIVVVHEDANYDNLWQHGQPRAQAVGGAPVNPKSPSKPSGYSHCGKDDKGKGKDKGSGKGKDSGKDGGKSSGKADLQANKPKLPCFAEAKARGSCVNGDKCRYSHDPQLLRSVRALSASTQDQPPAAVSKAESASPKRSSRGGRGNAAKAAAKVAAGVAAVGSMIAPGDALPIVCQPCLEFISDSGAGRSVFSRESLLAQDPSLKLPEMRPPSECLEFVTANGSTGPVGETTLNTSLGCLNAYELSSSPFAVSMGQVVSQGCPFVWVDPNAPFHVKPERAHELQIIVPEDAKIYASRVDQFVPVFKDTVHLSPAASVPASSSDPPVQASPAVTGSRAGKYKVVRFSDDGEKLTTEAVDEEPPLQSGESSEDPNQDLWVLNAPHQLCHFPHRPDCEICCRAKMRTQQVARKRPAAPRGLGGQLCAPCQELSTDTIIMSKGQDDRRMSSDGQIVCSHNQRQVQWLVSRCTSAHQDCGV